MDKVAKKFLLFLLTALITVGGVAQKSDQIWRPLFNGKNLDGWDTYLRATNLTGYADDTTGPYQPPIGLNNDPLKVFTVKDGLLHISGEIWGAVTHKEIFGNYHLRFETKWGKKKYAPKDNSPRDGGLLFHCTEGFDYAFKCWMRSMEMQVQEGEIGDFFNVGGGNAEFQFTPAIKTIYNETADQYDPSQPPLRHPGRVYRSGNFESPQGAWTTSELVARHSDAVFIVNGFVVNRMFNIFRQDLKEQVIKGKIQFQSEGAEHYYRKIDIRPISFEQTNPVIITPHKELVITATGTQQIELMNKGEAVEIIAVELIGKSTEQFVVKLPSLPYLLKKGGKLVFPVSLQKGNSAPNKVAFRLETVLGPVAGFEVNLIAK